MTIALLVLLMLASTSCFEAFYCDRLEALARDGAVQEELRAWVKDHVVGKTISEREVVVGELFVPGFRWSGMTFDAGRLGFGADAHVRLIGPQHRNVLDDTVTESLESVLFTESSRTGILVRLPSSKRFGVDEKHLVRVADDIAVLCYEVDD